MIRKLLLSSLVLLLAACGALPETTTEVRETMARPASDQPVTTEARKKSKIHVDLGTAYLEGARLGIALDEARAAIEYDPGYAPAHLLLALVYSYLDQMDTAAVAFREAARLAPGDPEVNNSYGWFLCSRGQDAEGLRRLESAARNPYYRTPTRAYTNAGLCYLRRNNDTMAELQFQRAYENDPGNRQAIFHLAAIAYRKGNYDGARQWLVQLEKIMPTASPEKLWLGLRIERKLGNRQAESDYAFRLRRDFAASEEYQAFLQGRFE